MSVIPPYFYTVIDLTNSPIGPVKLLPHVTVTPPVSATGPGSIDTAVDTLRHIASTLQPFTISIGEHDMFGPNHDIPVRRIIDSTGTLQTLHRKMIAALETAGYTVDDIYANDRYNAHVTLAESLPEPGGVIHVGHLAVIRKGRDRKREVYALLPLATGTTPEEQ